MRHIIMIMVENDAGVLTRVAGLFSARGYNIESLNVAATLDPNVSRMTLVTRGNDQVIEQIKKQLNKLIPVIKTDDLVHSSHLEREMLLIKVTAKNEFRAEILRMADVFRAKVIDVSSRSYTMELTGRAEKLDGFIEMLRPMGIIELTRTGPVGMSRGKKAFTLSD
ncbi:MAG: acetolactate synthase small subunit [Mariprofundaceae bacterium]|nr:acetolactate synthase small subunit [Mariprofundaceae bacterium]